MPDSFDDRRTRRDVLKLGTAAALAALAPPVWGTPARRPHVLNLAVDDLRTTLGCYGDPAAITPNLDALAGRGAVFEQAYVQQAVCSASRASLLTGLRPTAAGVDYPYNDHFIERVVPACPTFPTWFERQGAWSRMVGKVHHQAHGRIEELDAPHVSTRVDGQSWRDYVLAENRAAEEAGAAPAWEAGPVGDGGYRDGRAAEAACGLIRGYAETSPDEPMFLSVGFVKPHLPFNAPRKYFDLYDPDALPDFRTPPPAGGNEWSRRSFELGGHYADRPARGNARLDDATARQLTHAYYASVSYVDAMVGRVLEQLGASGMADDTLVVLWSDHGFHLGDQQMWGKHANYDTATRAPLIFAGPGVPRRRVPQIVEMLDVYPTLCDLTATPRPGHLQGRSLVPLMRGRAEAWEQRAFSEYERDGGEANGWSVRVPGWRYVQWEDAAGGVLARELYDFASGAVGEAVNVVEKHPGVVARLSAMLPEGRAPLVVGPVGG